MQAAIDGANHQSTNSMLEQLLEVINHTFDFRKKISVNMELLQSNVARMATHGIVIGVPQLVPMLLANIKIATKADLGNKQSLVKTIKMLSVQTGRTRQKDRQTDRHK